MWVWGQVDTGIKTPSFEWDWYHILNNSSLGAGGELSLTVRGWVN